MYDSDSPESTRVPGRNKEDTNAAKYREELQAISTTETISNSITQPPSPQPPPKVYPRNQSIEEAIAPDQDVPSRRFRRGRGARQVVGVNGSDDPNDPVC